MFKELLIKKYLKYRQTREAAFIIKGDTGFFNGGRREKLTAAEKSRINELWGGGISLCINWL